MMLLCELSFFFSKTSDLSCCYVSFRNLSAIQDREICCYSISCKEKDNIDITLQWLIQHSKSRRS
ncbi:hypothetical protein E2320_009829 [Naja naja]|nr:hypothetical protein E2320_009829 [Naja naja]